MNDKIENTILAIIIVLFLACSAFFFFMFINCIVAYPEFEVDYSDLIYKELTFERYQKHRTKGGHYYSIYFQEHEKPYTIDNITSKGVDKKALERLSPNAKVQMYLLEDTTEDYDFQICEMRSNAEMILSLSDYTEVNQNNQIIGIVFMPFMVLMGLFMAWMFYRGAVPIKENGGLGKLRIEHRRGENCICVYHSGHVCSLVIDGKVFDQHSGVFANHFCLKGMVKSDGKVIRVKARMGTCYMRLYCNDRLVAKKFMAFG